MGICVALGRGCAQPAARVYEALLDARAGLSAAGSEAGMDSEFRRPSGNSYNRHPSNVRAKPERKNLGPDDNGSLTIEGIEKKRIQQRTRRRNLLPEAIGFSSGFGA
jgi:hypothetical protein